MNKNVKILLIILLAAAAIYFVVVNKPWTTLKSELKDFAIKDTAAIAKVFLADKQGRQVLLEMKEQGVWMVDGKFEADAGKINLLKSTMHDVEVRNPLSESEFGNMVASMAADAVKAEFYNASGKLIKTIYVGSQTADQTGTYMMIDGSLSPFVTHIPGFVGYLSPRFSTESIRWKTSTVFNTPEHEIALVKVDYPNNTAQSFEVINGEQAVVKNKEGREAPVASAVAKFYLGGFTKLNFEGYVEDVKPHENDSMLALTPFCVIELVTQTGTSTRLTIHQKGVGRKTKLQYDETGNRLPFDTERYIAFLNEERNMIYIQQYNFGRVIKTLEELVKTKDKR